MLRRAIRRLIAAVLFAALRARARQLPMLPPDSILLIIAPHPDDESLGCGRLIAAHSDAGGITHIAWLTDGEASQTSVETSELARRRRTEAAAAAALLGVPTERCHRFGAPDGRLSSLDPSERMKLVAELVTLVANLRPAEVFVTSAFDGSTEHAAAHALVAAALARAEPAPRLRTYLVWAHWNVRALWTVWHECRAVCWRADPVHNARRAAAISAHLTQTQPWPPAKAALLSEHFLACFPANGEFYLDH